MSMNINYSNRNIKMISGQQSMIFIIGRRLWFVDCQSLSPIVLIFFVAMFWAGMATAQITENALIGKVEFPEKEALRQSKVNKAFIEVQSFDTREGAPSLRVGHYDTYRKKHRMYEIHYTPHGLPHSQIAYKNRMPWDSSANRIQQQTSLRYNADRKKIQHEEISSARESKSNYRYNPQGLISRSKTTANYSEDSKTIYLGEYTYDDKGRLLTGKASSKTWKKLDIQEAFKLYAINPATESRHRYISLNDSTTEHRIETRKTGQDQFTLYQLLHYVHLPNQLIGEKQHLNIYTQQVENRTVYRYNTKNKISEERQYTGLKGGENILRYTYGASGNLLEKTETNAAHESLFEYNENGLIQRKTTTYSKMQLKIVWTYIYE